MEFKSLLNVLRRRWRMGAIIFGSIFLTIVGGALLITPWYETSAKVVITRPRAAAAALNAFGLNTYIAESSMSDDERDTWVGLAQMSPVLDEVATRLDLQKERIRYRLLFAIPGLRSTLEFLGIKLKTKRLMSAKELTDSSLLLYVMPYPHMEISQYNSSNIIEIAAWHTDKETARQMADLTAKIFMETEFNRVKRTYADLVAFVDKNLDSIKRQHLKDLEARRKYQIKEKTISLDSEVSALVTRISDAQKSMEEIKVNIFRDRSAIASMEKQLRNIPEFQKSAEDLTRSNDSLVSLKGKLADQYLLLMEAQNKYHKGHPELSMAQERVDEITRQIKAEMGKLINLDSSYASLRYNLIQTYAELAGFEAQEKTWPLVLAGYEKELLAKPEKIVQQAWLDINVKASQNVYQLYQEYRQKLNLAGDVDIKTLDLVEPARLTPDDEAKPKMKTVLALTLVLATFFGLGAIFFLEFVDTSVHSPEELEQFGVLNYLGLVSGALARPRQLVAVSDPNSPVNEAVRGVRHALRLSGGLERSPHFVLASASGQEGKAFLAANLAAGLAGEGKRVLLVDGDLRTPSLHSFFGLENMGGWGAGPGKTPALGDLARATGVAGLSLITAGPTPEDIGRRVESPEVGELLAQARGEYDHILWLGPPLLSASDSLIFGEKLGGVLLVVQACKTGRQEVGQALGLVRTAQLDLLGMALTF